MFRRKSGKGEAASLKKIEKMAKHSRLEELDEGKAAGDRSWNTYILASIYLDMNHVNIDLPMYTLKWSP
jgi:hypothetical protein